MFENVPFFEHTHSKFAQTFMMILIPNKQIWVQKLFRKKVIGKKQINKAKKCKIQKTQNSHSFLFLTFFSEKPLPNIAEHFAYQSTQFQGICNHHKILLIFNAYAQKRSIFRHLGKK
jgi:hypothetical protein